MIKKGVMTVMLSIVILSCGESLDNSELKEYAHSVLLLKNKAKSVRCVTETDSCGLWSTLILTF